MNAAIASVAGIVPTILLRLGRTGFRSERNRARADFRDTRAIALHVPRVAVRVGFLVAAVGGAGA
jgi:hypothetical protein